MSTDKDNISKDDLFDVIKYGYIWHAKKIKEELNNFLEKKSHIFNHAYRYDHEDKYYYIYDNECLLFIFDEKIDVRSDRENAFSQSKIFSYKIKEAKDIEMAYEHFCSMTMENDED